MKPAAKRALSPEEQRKVERLLNDADTLSMFANARPGASQADLRKAVEDFVRNVSDRHAIAETAQALG